MQARANLGLLALILMLGCGQKEPPSEATPAGTGGFPVKLTDSLGRQVTIERRPARIVSLAPTATEVLFAVGAGPQVVAVTELDAYPPEVRGLPTIGGYTAKTLSVEAVVGQRPDLAISIGSFQAPVIEALEGAGVTVLTIEPRTFEDVIANIELVGRATGHEERAREVGQAFRERWLAVRERTRAIPEEQRPRVLYVISDEPLMTVGPGSFIGQMITDAGGVNVFADAVQEFPRVGDELVLARDADVILTPDYDTAAPKRLAVRPGWDRLRAVREGRVYTIDEDLLSRPGPRLIEGLEAVEEALRRVKRQDATLRKAAPGTEAPDDSRRLGPESRSPPANMLGLHVPRRPVLQRKNGQHMVAPPQQQVDGIR